MEAPDEVVLIPSTYADEYELGRWHMWYPPDPCSGIQPLTIELKKGNYVLLYKAEIEYSWTEEPVPPDTEGPIYQGSWEKWFESRKDGVEAVAAQEKTITGNEGTIKTAKVWRVAVKITPMKQVIRKILNKEGIEGKSYLAWEINRPDGRDVIIGGKPEEQS